MAIHVNKQLEMNFEDLEETEETVYDYMSTSTLVEGRWHRLLDVNRFGNRPSVSRISVASHSWMTTMLAMFLFDAIGPECFNSEEERVRESDNLLRKCILHDIEECVLGDIPLEAITFEEVKGIKKRIGSDIVEDLIGKRYVDHWQNAKESYTGYIMSFADMLSALIEALRESKLGNKTYADVLTQAPEFLDKIRQRVNDDMEDGDFFIDNARLQDRIHDIFTVTCRDIKYMMVYDFGI